MSLAMNRSPFRFLVLLAAVVGLAGLAAPAARADVSIDVNQGVLQPMPIAIPAFTGATPYAADIAGVISADLQRSGLFKPLDPGMFVEKAPDPNLSPNYANWKQISSQALVAQEITYMVLRDTGSSVYLYNLETNRRESLGNYSGMVFAPRFSPDGSKVAFSVEQAGNTDIYVMDLRSHSTRRLTTDPSIDTSPAFSPDGSQLVFNSDRGGSPQLYAMNADGSNQHRITFGEGRYTDPVWSPTGDLIAFTKQTGSTFHIGVMKPDGSGEKILTSSYLDEGPTWAPNGRVIMFFREAGGGGPKLWTVDVTGRIEQAAPYPGSASDPAWSPLLN